MRVVTVAALVFSLCVGLPAAAFDLTGHWVGSWSCAEFELGVKDKASSRLASLIVTSLGDGTFRAILDDNAYSGIELPSASDPDRGEVALVSCSSDNDLASGSASELARFKVSTSGARGSMSGTSFRSANSDHIATCTHRWTRVDTIDEGLAFNCP